MALQRRGKRILIGLGLVLLVLGALMGAIFYSAFGGNSAIVDGLEPAPGIRLVKDGFVTVGVIDVGNDQVALIDCGNDRAGKAVLAELARRGLAADAVTSIFLTHGHGDHLNGCALFPRAAVMAMAAEVDMVEGRARAKGPLPRWMPPNAPGLHVARALVEDERVAVGTRRVHVFAVPGHTAGSAAYLVDGVVFLGDSGEVTTHNTIAPAPWVASDDRKTNLASLNALGVRLQVSGEPVRTIAPAHSGVLTRPNVAQALTNVQ